MRYIIIILILSYFLINLGLGFEMQTTMKVAGDGTLYSRIYNNGLEDMANGSGEQTFSRNIQSGDDTAKLSSNYIYVNNGSQSNSENTHYVSGQGDVGILHYANINSKGSIESRAVLEKTEDSIKTDYSIKSDSGHLTEGVIDFRHGASKLMEESELTGDITFASKLSEKLNIVLDVKGLIYKTDSVELMDSYEIKNGIKIPKAIGGGELSKEDSAIVYYNEAYDLEKTAREEEGENKSKILEKALENITSALSLNENYFDAWLLQGTILFSLERFDESLNAFEEADRINSNNETLIGKAKTLYFLKRYSDSASAADEILKLKPNDLFALNMKGKSYYMIGRLPDAKAVFEAALLIYPGNSNLLSNMGLVQLALSNSTDSKNESLKLIKDSLKMGLEKEDPDLAREAEDALKDALPPEDAAVMYYNEAFDIEGEAQAQDGENKTKLLEEALESITSASSLDPEYFDAWLLQGELLFNLNRYSEAFEAFSKADEIEQSIDTLTGKAKSLFYLNRYSEAISLADELLSMDQYNAFALNMKGKSLYMLGRSSEALEILNLSLSIYPNDPTLLYNMGLVQLALGKTSEAKSKFGFAIDSGLEEINPKYAEDARTKLHDMG